MDSGLYREAMKIVAKADIPVLAHCEDINLVQGGVINQGNKSKELGVSGISNAVENVIVARDIMLAEETGARLHLCHCSTKESVELVRDAKKKGIKVSGEVCPHHFTLTEDDIVEGDANYKMNPPLRTKADVDALKAGLRDDIMEVISTDHAPAYGRGKGKRSKERTVWHSRYGDGSSTYLYRTCKNRLPDPDGYGRENESPTPARILGINKGDISVGRLADITIFDPKDTYEINAAEFASKGKNMPFEGRKVTGRVVGTILDGRIVYQK